MMTNHWVVNNVFSIANVIVFFDKIRVNNFKTAVILLTGFFALDGFLCFGTNVMETVAMNFKAPVMIHFPMDFITNGWNSNMFLTLGLGDIFLPGCFIALIRRFDLRLKRNSSQYFNATLFAYSMGLCSTVFAIRIFNQGQPALLYLVPACILTPVLIASASGELKQLLK